MLEPQISPSGLSHEESLLVGSEIVVGIIGEAFESQILVNFHDIHEGSKHWKSGLRVA